MYSETLFSYFAMAPQINHACSDLVRFSGSSVDYCVQAPMTMQVRHPHNITTPRTVQKGTQT